MNHQVSLSLDDLSSQYPLTEQWSKIDLFESELSLGLNTLKMCGLAVKGPNDLTITGSAAELNRIPLERSYFELIERCSVIEAIHSTHNVYANLFPKSSRIDLWSYSKSNGVALHVNVETARESAFLEVIERDRILRSWYGEFSPIQIFPTLPFDSEWINQRYVLESFCFHDPFDIHSEVEVAGIFAFPKKNDPILFGFGAGRSIEQAWQHAFREFLQRVAFLWDESFPEVEPAFSPSPEYHLEIHHHPQNQGKLRNWLKGNHRGVSTFHVPAEDRQKVYSNRFSFHDLTPLHLKGRLYVIKAICQQRMPLTFGKTHPWIKTLNQNIGVHPIA